MVAGIGVRTSSPGPDDGRSPSDRGAEERSPGGGPPPDGPAGDAGAHPSRFPSIEGVRALAALAIVAYHVGELGQTQGLLARVGGRLTLGVPVFFVISAFVLYRPFVAARAAGTPAPAVGPFLLRRVARIVPLYWISLTLVWATSPLLSSATRTDFFNGVPWWRYYLFSQVYDGASSIAALAPAWSLNVELVFYLLLPLWALPAAWLVRRGVPVHLELAALALVVVGGTALLQRYTLSYVGKTPPANAGFFAVGMALAILSVDLGTRRPMLVSRVVGVVGRSAPAVVALAVGVFLVAPEVPHYEWARLAVAAVAVLPAVFIRRPTAVTARLLTERHLQAIGVLSYGVYLFHRQIALGLRLHLWAPMSPFDLLVALAAVLALTVLLASASYRYLEQPLMRRAKAVRRPGPAPG